MQFKSIQALRGSRPISIVLPDKKSIVLSGRRDDSYYLFDMMRVSFGMDYNDNLGVYKFRSEEILKNQSSLRFTTGMIKIVDGAVSIDGKVPHIHVVQVMPNGSIRSYLVSNKSHIKDLDNDMTKYSSVIPYTDWLRLVELFNKFAKFECAKLTPVDGGIEDVSYSLSFSGITEELQTAWLLMSESFLTPKDYLRVVLLPELNGYTPDDMYRLIDVADNISHLEMVFTCAEVDIKPGSVITEVTF